MKLSVTYTELQDYVSSHFHKTVNLGYVDGATISVSVPIKVFGFTKSVSINPNRSLEKASCHFLMTAIRKTALYMLDS